MVDPDEIRLLRKIASLYWLEDMDQAEIGRQLGISKSTVSRKLSAARREGIVQVRVAGSGRVERDEELEQQLLERFRLRDVFVADTGEGEDPLRAVGHLGAQYFVREAPLCSRIGFGWGLTISSIASQVPQISLRSDTVLTPIVGGMPSVDSTTSGNHEIFSLAEKSGARARRFDAPAIVESPLTQRALLSESSVADALEFGRGCDLSFVGIGAFGIRTSARVLEAMRLSAEELDAVHAGEPVGDVLGRFFDRNGEMLGPPSSERVIALDIADLRNIRTAVAVAAGVEKVQGVLGALHSEAFDVLIVDRLLAEMLLDATQRG